MCGRQWARRPFAAAVTAAGVLLLGSALLLGITECADGAGTPVAAPSEQDARAIEQLSEIAGRDAEPEGAVREVECWAPSQNPLAQDAGMGVGAGTQPFRVLCRVHFDQQRDQQRQQRYRDMICIGDLGRDPVTEYCYQWAYYAGAAKFEDHPAFAATAAGSR